MPKRRRGRRPGRLRSMFETVFHRPQFKAADGYFQTFTAYAPHFTSWQGSLYEAELTRSAIEAGADHASKLKPEISGTAKPQATRSLRLQPNPWQTTPQFIRRIWTILQVNDTCLIAPVMDADGVTQVGYYPILPNNVDCYEIGGKLWLKFSFPSGDSTLIEWGRVGVMTRHQYENDLFGDGGSNLDPTLELMHMQEEAEKTAMEQGAAIRFIGKFAQNLPPDDMRKRRKEFNEQLGADNAGGIAVYDRAFESVEAVTPHSYTVDAAQMERIEKAVYRYFGVNEDVILNRASEETFASFYEGRIEPFAVELGTVLTAMTFTPYEISCGNEITFSANRLEFASNTTKMQVATALFDRGIWSGNDVADVFQSAHYDGGEKHVIRGEYIDASLISQHTVDDADAAALTNSAIDNMGNGNSSASKEGDDAK